MPSTPEKENAPPIVETERSASCLPSSLDSEAAAYSAQAAKRFITLQALAALGGYELTCADDCAGPFRISRWNLSIDLPDLAAVADWIEKATGRRAD